MDLRYQVARTMEPFAEAGLPLRFAFAWDVGCGAMFLDLCVDAIGVSSGHGAFSIIGDRCDMDSEADDAVRFSPLSIRRDHGKIACRNSLLLLS